MRKLLALIVLLCIAPGAWATNYYLDNFGDDGENGLTIGTAWATLQYAKGEMVSGDTLLILGGIYSDAQYVHDYLSTIADTLTFKAYGDSQAVFQLVANTAYPDDYEYDVYFLIIGAVNDGFVIDGFSSLDADSSGWLKFESHEDSRCYVDIRGSSSNHAYGITVRGVIFDGEFGAIGNTDRVRHGIIAKHWDGALIEHNTINYCYHPTGSISPGDASDESQGTGDGILLQSCQNMIVRYNTLSNCNHCAIDLGGYLGGETYLHKYISIYGNTINQHWGGGIYLTCSAEYCLVDSNLIVNCGGTTTFNKPGVQVSGKHNVIRRNVIYNPANQGIDMEAQTFSSWDYITDSCMVYNNTVFGSGHGYSLKIYVNNASDANCSAENMVIANNILYKSDGMPTDINATCEIVSPFGNTNDAHNWLDPDASDSEPASTHWGGNIFKNNCIRRNSDGAAHDSLIAFVMDATYGGATRRYSLDDAETQDATAWHDNIGTDPTLVSETPNAYGVTAGWWYLQSGSPGIDAGVAIDDTIGTYVEEQATGYGWDTLTYSGSAPDMGAYEGAGEETPSAAECSLGVASITFDTLTSYTYSDTSFYIYNTVEAGGSALAGTVGLATGMKFSLQAGSGSFSIDAGDSLLVTVRFAPTAIGATSDIITTGTNCDNISMMGVLYTSVNKEKALGGRAGFGWQCGFW